MKYAFPKQNLCISLFDECYSKHFMTNSMEFSKPKQCIFQTILRKKNIFKENLFINAGTFRGMWVALKFLRSS